MQARREVSASQALPPEQTLELLRARDQDVFTELVVMHDAELVQVCFVICGDVEMARDATQNTWHRLWSRPPALAPPERPEEHHANSRPVGLVRVCLRRRRGTSRFLIASRHGSRRQGSCGPCFRRTSSPTTVLLFRRGPGVETAHQPAANGPHCRSRAGTRGRVWKLPTSRPQMTGDGGEWCSTSARRDRDEVRLWALATSRDETLTPSSRSVTSRRAGGNSPQQAGSEAS